MSLNSAFIAHQIWLQRFASQEVNRLTSFVGRMRDEVKDQVNGFGDTGRTRSRLSKMLRGLEDALYLVTGDWHDKLLGDLEDLGGYEADWTARTMKANINAEFAVPSPTQVMAAAKFNPLALGSKPAGFIDLLEGWQDAEVNRLVTGVKSGFVQGKATRDIVREVVGPGGLADVSSRNAAAVVRTAVNHVSTQAKEETYQQNSDVVEGYIWVSTLDSRTSTTCFTGDTELSPVAGMNSVMRAKYSGEVITVKLATGNKFSGTPEHPVLTQFGWTPIKELDPSKHVLYTIPDNIRVVEINKNIDMPARAEEIFDSAVEMSVTGVDSVSPTAADFYGDGVRLDGKIHIVRTDSVLGLAVDPRATEKVEDMRLRSVHAAGLLNRKGAGDLIRNAHGFTYMSTAIDPLLPEQFVKNAFAKIRFPHTFGGTSSREKQVDRDALPVESLGGNETSWSVLHESELLQKVSDSRSGDPVLLAYSGRGNAISIQATNIVSVDVEFRSCHVFTLSSSRGYYTAGGAIVKNCRHRDQMEFELGKGPLPPAHPNCRSTTAPKVSSDFDFLDVGAKRAARGSDGGMQVSAETSYYDFLKAQPAWFQDEALGPTRGKIFRDAGLSPEEFRSITVDGFGRPLTLKEMGELDRRVADYLAKLRNQQ